MDISEEIVCHVADRLHGYISLSFNSFMLNTLARNQPDPGEGEILSMIVRHTYMCGGTRGALLSASSFKPITQDNSHQATSIIGSLVRDKRRSMCDVPCLCVEWYGVSL